MFNHPCVGKTAAVVSAVFFLALAVISAILAFPDKTWLLTTPVATAICWVLLIGSVIAAVWALVCRRWTWAFFHAGLACIVVGGALTAAHAEVRDLTLTASEYARAADRQTMVEGDIVTLKSFRIERYPNSMMPKQYYSVVAFPEGEYEISVNHPLRRKGLTYFQHSWDKTQTPYGDIVLWTVLRVRRDIGAPVVFIGYGLIVLGALLRAVWEERK